MPLNNPYISQLGAMTHLYTMSCLTNGHETQIAPHFVLPQSLLSLVPYYKKKGCRRLS